MTRSGLQSFRGFRGPLSLLRRPPENRSRAQGGHRLYGSQGGSQVRVGGSGDRGDEDAGRRAREEVRGVGGSREIEERRPQQEIRGALREGEGGHLEADPGY